MKDQPPQEKPGPGRTEADHPSLVAPPPIIYLISILIGLVLHLWWRPVRLVPHGVGFWLGWIVFLLSAFTLILCFREFHRWATPINPHRPTARIIRTGPFRYSRNPVYMSLGGLQAGVALIIDSFWVLGMVVPALVVVYAGVILREERYLDGKFGAEYRSYKAAVGRWL